MHNVFRITSLIIFALLLISHFLCLFFLPHIQYLQTYCLYALTIFIVINWLSWNIWGGIITLLLIIISALYSWLFSETTLLLLVPIPAALLFVLMCIQRRRIDNLNTEIQLNLDKKQQTYNILVEKCRKERLLQEAYYKKTERFTELNRIAKDLSFNLAPAAINRKIIDNLTKTLDGGDKYTLWEIGKDLQSLIIKQVDNPGNVSPLESPASDIYNQWIMKYRQPLLIKNLSKDYRFNTPDIISQTPFKNIIASPLITGNKILGIVSIESRSSNRFSIEELRLLTIIANFAALIIQNAQLFKETEYLASRDGLTGLFAKHVFSEELRKMLHKVKQNELCLSLLMLDLDRFKLLNDTFGHRIGDKVLQKVAHIMSNTVPEKALTARYGGEEFVIILPDTVKTKAKQIAENIRTNIANASFSVRRKNLHTSISIGVAEAPINGKTPKELITNADQALYKAKHNGRNRVEISNKAQS